MRNRQFVGRSLRFVLLTVVVTFVSCAKLLGGPPDPELKRVLVLVSSSYLGAVVLGDVRAIHSFTIWADLVEPMGEDKYLARVAAIQNRWDDDEHPIKGLDLEDVAVRGNTATVRFKKVEGTSHGTIVVKLIWNGSGWAVVDDSLFGDGELIAKLTEARA